MRLRDHCVPECAIREIPTKHHVDCVTNLDLRKHCSTPLEVVKSARRQQSDHGSGEQQHREKIAKDDDYDDAYPARFREGQAERETDECSYGGWGRL